MDYVGQSFKAIWAKQSHNKKDPNNEIKKNFKRTYMAI